MRGIFSDGTRIMAVGEKGEIFGTKYQSTDIGAQDSGVTNFAECRYRAAGR